MATTRQLSFAPLTRRHLPTLQQWLAQPHVARWWNHDPSPEAVERDFGPGIDVGDDMVVHVDGTPVGLIQLSRFADYPEYANELEHIHPVGAGTATIDFLIGEPELVGCGLGSKMISAFVEVIWEQQPNITELVVPVNASNEASWRALLNAGFRRVAEGEMDPDNPIDGRDHVILRKGR